MKKILSMILVLFMAVSVIGCGRQSEKEVAQEKKEISYGEYIHTKTEMLKGLRLNYKSQVDEFKKKPEVRKDKNWMAEVKQNSEGFNNMYSELLQYDIDVVPKKYKDAHEKLTLTLEMYAKAGKTFYAACKENRSAKAIDSLNYYKEGNSYLKEVQKGIKAAE